MYARPGEDLRGQAREDAIIEAARALNDLDIDLLKLEYPGSPEGCRRLAAVLSRPWAVLSAGVPFDQFTDIIRIAADEGGASGFIAGRSVWREVVSLTGQPRDEFLTSVALPRLERLVEVAEHRARPWTEVGARLPIRVMECTCPDQARRPAPVELGRRTPPPKSHLTAAYAGGLRLKGDPCGFSGGASMEAGAAAARQPLSDLSSAL